MLWVLSKELSWWDCSFDHPKHMFNLMNKKIITILAKLILLNWPYHMLSIHCHKARWQFCAWPCLILTWSSSFSVFLSVLSSVWTLRTIWKAGAKSQITKLEHGTKKFKYCTCPAGRMTYKFHLSCKHMHLSFKSLCYKEHKGVICNTTSSSIFSQSARPTGRVLWEELLVLSRFHS